MNDHENRSGSILNWKMLEPISVCEYRSESIFHDLHSDKEWPDMLPKANRYQSREITYRYVNEHEAVQEHADTIYDAKDKKKPSKWDGKPDITKYYEAWRKWHKWHKGIRIVMTISTIVNMAFATIILLGVGVNSPVFVPLSTIPLIVGVIMRVSACFADPWPEVRPSCRWKFWIAVTAPIQTIIILAIGFASAIS